MFELWAGTIEKLFLINVKAFYNHFICLYFVVADSEVTFNVNDCRLSFILKFQSTINSMLTLNDIYSYQVNSLNKA